MKYYLLALFLGAISPLGFAPYDIWPLVFISISGLIYLINSKKTKNYFLMVFFLWKGFWAVGFVVYYLMVAQQSVGFLSFFFFLETIDGYKETAAYLSLIHISAPPGQAELGDDGVGG